MTHYVIDRTQSNGNKLANFIALCDSAVSEGGEIHAALDSGRNPGPDDTQLEGATKGFGIAATQGAAIFALVNSIKSALDTFAAATASWRASLRQE